MYCNKIRLLRDNAIFHPHIQAKNLLAQQQHSRYTDGNRVCNIDSYHVLPKHTLLLLACNTNKQLDLTSISKVVFGVFQPCYLSAYYFEICE